MAHLVPYPFAPKLLDLLRSTLEHLENAEGLEHDDPALLEIKASILRSIAELELAKERKPRAA